MEKQAYYQGQPFWSGSVNLPDGKIEEVHSYEEALEADFHHSLYFSKTQLERMEEEECAFFFINKGEIEGCWRDSLPANVLEQIREQITFEAHEEITGAMAKAAIESLGLADRSLTYSEVEVRTDFGYDSFLVPGICDRDALESSDRYQELMEDADETQVNVSVSSYSVGNGESDYPNENELVVIEQYAEELEEEYGVDCIQTDFFSFSHEPEAEY